MNLTAKRRAIRFLLDEQQASDALAAYYAFYHPDSKTNLITQPLDAARASGYVALSRTGIDLFRPFATMRLPLTNPQAAAELVQNALLPGAAAILCAPDDHGPLLHAFFDIQVEERLRVMALDVEHFQPVINVLVREETAPNGTPRFVIRSGQDHNYPAASAGINWQSPRFAEISVHTEADQRRQGWGRSVVAALCQHLIDRGRTPLYAVGEGNFPSQQLAETSGFVDLGIRRLLLQGVRQDIIDQHP